MTEYTERKKLEEALDNADPDVCESYPYGHSYWGFGRENIRNVISGIPPADVAPVVHGRWEWETGDIYRCTNCNGKAHVKEVMNRPAWDFCPNCGVRMDGDGNG